MTLSVMTVVASPGVGGSAGASTGPAATVVAPAVTAAVATAGLALTAAGAAATSKGFANLMQAAKGGGGGGGRGSNNLTPAPDAEGPHVTFRMDQDGNVTNYVEWEENPQNPSGFDEIKRVDVTGGSHFDKATGEDIPTPHVHEGGSVRPARPDEVPK